MNDLPCQIEALRIKAPPGACDKWSPLGVPTPLPTSQTGKDGINELPGPTEVLGAGLGDPRPTCAPWCRDTFLEPNLALEFSVLWTTLEVGAGDMAALYACSYRTVMRWRRRLGLMTRQELRLFGPGSRARHRRCVAAWPMISEEAKTLLVRSWSGLRPL